MPLHHIFFKAEIRSNTVILLMTIGLRSINYRLDSSLSFTLHIGNITSKAFKILGFIKRVACFSNGFSIKLRYFSLVRFHLNYAGAQIMDSFTGRSLQVENDSYDELNFFVRSLLLLIGCSIFIFNLYFYCIFVYILSN